jgi:hypothetical protein
MHLPLIRIGCEVSQADVSVFLRLEFDLCGVSVKRPTSEIHTVNEPWLLNSAAQLADTSSSGKTAAR